MLKTQQFENESKAQSEWTIQSKLQVQTPAEHRFYEESATRNSERKY